MKHRIEKTLVIPGTLYAHMEGGQKEYGDIKSPMWVVDLKTGMLQEIKPNTASFMKEIYPENYQGQMIAFLILTPKLMFSVDNRDDVYKDTFRSVTREAQKRGLCRTWKGNHMLFLDQHMAAKKSYEILLKKYTKIGKEMELMKYLNSFIK